MRIPLLQTLGFTCLGLSALLVTASPTQASYMSTVLADNPIAYYRLDQSSGTTMTSTVNAPAKNGTYVNSPTLGVAGALNPYDTDKAVHFTSSSLQYADTPSLFDPSSTDWTLAFWINPSIVNEVGSVISQQSGVGAGRDWVFFNPTTHGLSSFFNGVEETGTGALPTNTWTAIALTFDKTTSTLRWYKNGSPTTTTAVTIQSANGGMNFAVDRLFDPGSGMNGSLDEVSFYTTRLSDAQVLEQFDSALPEPATFGLLLFVVPMMARRRRVR